MSGIHYSLNPVVKKPERRTPRQRGSNKYATIIEAFLKSKHSLVRVEGTGKEANYLCGQLKKLCKQRSIKSVNVTVRNKEVYLEKTE
jgi:hypothetical protein